MRNFMMAAIEEALMSLDEGGIPIGAVLVHKGNIIGRGHNRRIQKNSVILHAEMDALENAGRLTAASYKDCVMYTTLSPCTMCSGAILLYGIPKIVIGENQTFMGAESLLKANNLEVVVENCKECIEIMQQFILKHPDLWNEDIGK
jgi:cytosine/creatinine deaminase